MLSTRVLFGGALLCAWIGACGESETNSFDCVTGRLNCSCTANAQCDADLVCNSHNLCVKPGLGEAGESTAGGGGESATTGTGGKGSGKAG